MEIEQIGHSIVHAHNRNLHLNNVLYVQQASKSLVSVHKLASDNNVFLEFHPNYFFSRIGKRREFFCKADVKEDSTP